MKTEITELTSKLKTLTARRDELTKEFEDAGRDHAETQAGLITGKNKAADVVESQTRRNALAEALANLETQITALESELQAARVADVRAQAVQQMAELAKDADAHFQNVLRLRREASDALAPFIEKMLAEFLTLRAHRVAFIEAGERLQPGFAANREYSQRTRPDVVDLADALAKEILQHGGDLNALTIPFGVGQCVIDQNLPFGFQWEASGEFGGSVHGAFMQALNRQQNAIGR